MEKEKEIILELTRELLREIWDDLSGGNTRSINQLRQHRDQTLIINHKDKQYWIKYDETLHSFIKEQGKRKNNTGTCQRGTQTFDVDKTNKFNHEEYKRHKDIDKKNNKKL
jgi:hypothetical protein